MKIKLSYDSIIMQLIMSKSLGINGQRTAYNVAALTKSKDKALQKSDMFLKIHLMDIVLACIA